MYGNFKDESKCHANELNALTKKSLFMESLKEPSHRKIMYFPCKTASHLNMDPDNANLLFSLVSCISTTFLSEQVQMAFSSKYMDQV